MSLPTVLFALIAAVTACSALGVVISRSVVRAAVWLLFTLIGVSVLYFLLGAEFLGAAQLIIYVGGTLVLVVFGVMLTSQGPFDGIKPRRIEWIMGGTLALALFGLLARVSLDAIPNGMPITDNDQPLPGAGPLGLSFLGVSDSSTRAYLLPFEIVSVHLLVVLIAAAYLARAKRKSGNSQPVETP